MKSEHNQLWEDLRDIEFRRQFLDANVDEGIAFQIRSIRNKKGLTQPEFARELGVKQPLVSAWENPAYGKYSVNTLKKMAKAFDVGLLVRFVPFSTIIDWTINVTPQRITPLNFSEENIAIGTVHVSMNVASDYINKEVSQLDTFNIATRATNAATTGLLMKLNEEMEKISA